MLTNYLRVCWWSCLLGVELVSRQTLIIFYVGNQWAAEQLLDESDRRTFHVFDCHPEVQDCTALADPFFSNGAVANVKSPHEHPTLLNFNNFFRV